jgi:phenylacetate-coenzyme A ligase PaaK-like adenylate-forming protein
MLETVAAQVRFATSILFARPFHLPALDQLIETLSATQQEFGELTREAKELVQGPQLDEATRRDLQLRRFRLQARRGAHETGFYGDLFAQLGLNPKQLTAEQIGAIPPVNKTTVQAQLAAFVRRSQQPTLRTMTTGTTGEPTGMLFTAHEMALFSALGALTYLLQRQITAADIVQVSTSSRALLGNNSFMGACQRVGALVYQTGIVEPSQALRLLAHKHSLAGKKPRPSVLLTYPSYLGRLVEVGAQLGMTPADLGVERIILGGEIVTAGVKRRCQALFGPVCFHEGYGITETWPFGATQCEAGHLHFEPSHGLLEVLDPESGQAAQPGDVGSLVLTPFAPYREAVVLLRYDTQDLVRVLDQPCTCALRHLPATGHLLGKRRLSVRTAHGWVTPRPVLEAVEALDEIPLPARCSFWAEADGVAVAVAALQNTRELRQRLTESLLAHDVPLRDLHLVESPADLKAPLPWRGDLHEQGF